MKKTFVLPWFGQLPPWMDQWFANFESALAPLGYSYILDTNLGRFRERVSDILKIKCSVYRGTGKVHDYRPTLGLLYKEELRDSDFWGHTDFDCVYGKVEEFIPDSVLTCLDIHSNHVDYICGPWTLYYNGPDICTLFQQYPHWRENLESPESNGWAETSFTRVVDVAHMNGELVRRYTHLQGVNPSDTSNLRLDGRRLFDGDEEIMMFHFRRTKKWPEQILY